MFSVGRAGLAVIAGVTDTLAMADPTPVTERPASTPVFRGLFCLVLLAVPVGFCLLAPVLFFGHHHERAHRTRCANLLRQFGLAAIQYSDDKRFFPHVNKIRTLDGDYDSNHTPRTVRALMYYGYHDNPEGWVCSESFDGYVPPRDQAWEAPRRWFWSGGILKTPVASPFLDGASDPTLRATDELSYGWTRKGYTANTRSMTMLGADRAVRTHSADPMPAGELGNHDDGLNVVRADATVEYLSTRQPLQLERFEPTKHLNLFRPSLFVDPAMRPVPFRIPEWAPAALAFAGFLGLLGWLYHMGWRRPGARLPAGHRRRKRRVRGKRKRWLTADVDGVGKVELGAEKVVNAAGKPKVMLSPNQRCPFCHDSLAETDDLVACVNCQTLLHRECVQEGGMCSTLGCTNQKK